MAGRDADGVPSNLAAFLGASEALRPSPLSPQLSQLGTEVSSTATVQWGQSGETLEHSASTVSLREHVSPVAASNGRGRRPPPLGTQIATRELDLVHEEFALSGEVDPRLPLPSFARTPKRQSAALQLGQGPPPLSALDFSPLKQHIQLTKATIVELRRTMKAPLRQPPLSRRRQLALGDKAPGTQAHAWGGLPKALPDAEDEDLISMAGLDKLRSDGPGLDVGSGEISGSDIEDLASNLNAVSRALNDLADAKVGQGPRKLGLRAEIERIHRSMSEEELESTAGTEEQVADGSYDQADEPLGFEEAEAGKEGDASSSEGECSAGGSGLEEADSPVYQMVKEADSPVYQMVR